jgi:hypothetical protein
MCGICALGLSWSSYLQLPLWELIHLTQLLVLARIGVIGLPRIHVSTRSCEMAAPIVNSTIAGHTSEAFKRWEPVLDLKIPLSGIWQQVE